MVTSWKKSCFALSGRSYLPMMDESSPRLPHKFIDGDEKLLLIPMLIGLFRPMLIGLFRPMLIGLKISDTCHLM